MIENDKFVTWIKVPLNHVKEEYRTLETYPKDMIQWQKQCLEKQAKYTFEHNHKNKRTFYANDEMIMTKFKDSIVFEIVSRIYNLEDKK